MNRIISSSINESSSSSSSAAAAHRHRPCRPMSSSSAAILVVICRRSLHGDSISCWLLERLKDGNIHMCFFSHSGYRPFINPPPSLGNLVLDITLCSISFRCRFVFVFVNFRLGSLIGLGFRVIGLLSTHPRP